MALPEDNPYLVQKMIYYCYFGRYDDSAPLIADTIKYSYLSRLQFSIEMYAMLDKFGMSGMQKAAEEKVKEWIATPATSKSLVAKNETILELIPLIYALTTEKDRTLRNPVCFYVAEHWMSFKALESFKEMMAKCPDFFFDVFEVKRVYTGCCRKCKRTNMWRPDHVTCGGCGWGERL